MRILAGVQPSGKLHLGNYFGAIRQFVALQETGDCLYFIADLHALTTVQDGARLRQLTIDVALDYVALGVDPGAASPPSFAATPSESCDRVTGTFKVLPSRRIDRSTRVPGAIAPMIGGRSLDCTIALPFTARREPPSRSR